MGGTQQGEEEDCLGGGEMGVYSHKRTQAEGSVGGSEKSRQAILSSTSRQAILNGISRKVSFQEITLMGSVLIQNKRARRKAQETDTGLITEILVLDRFPFPAVKSMSLCQVLCSPPHPVFLLSLRTIGWSFLPAIHPTPENILTDICPSLIPLPQLGTKM